ncbi:MAG: hypothetical protein AAGL69_15120 [Pseudomonadota bacterium]
MRTTLAIIIHVALTLSVFYWHLGWGMALVDSPSVTKAPVGFELLTVVLWVLTFPFIWLLEYVGDDLPLLLKFLLGGWVREGGLSLWAAVIAASVANTICAVYLFRFIYTLLKRRRR